MTEELIFASYPVYRVVSADPVAADPEGLTKQVEDLFAEWSDRVTVRGVYSTAGFTAGADLMMFLVGHSADDIQDLQVAFRKTDLGRRLEQTQAFLGLVRPAEFARDHLPAFVKGEAPKRYTCVYPFVRTPEWYLLDPKLRGEYLRDHGMAGREFPDVLANTTSAFGIGDYEWILCFEADGLDRIVELIRRLRGTEARRYTKLETPFVTGIRKDVGAVIADLP